MKFSYIRDNCYTNLSLLAKTGAAKITEMIANKETPTKNYSTKEFLFYKTMFEMKQYVVNYIRRKMD